MWSKLMFLYCLLVAEVAAISRHPVLIVFSFDGLGYQWFQKEKPPNLSKWKEEGASVECMYNVFSTQTSINHHSIATGLYPENHGIVGNILYDPKYGKQITRDDGAVFWRYDDTIVPIWMLNDLTGDGRHSASIGWPGAHVPLRNNYTPRYFMEESEGPSDWKQRVDIGLKWLTHPTDPANLLMIFSPEPDEYAHPFGTTSSEALRSLKAMDQVAGYLRDKLKKLDLYNRVNVMFVSDHGLVDHTQEDIIDIDSIIGKDHPYEHHGHGIVDFIRPLKEEDTEAIYFKLLEASKSANFSVYRKENIPKRWHYANSRRITPILLVADPGYGLKIEQMIKWSKRYNRTMSPTTLFGVHGYDNAFPSMHPIFIAHGPAFRSRYEGTPFNNIDLYPLMSRILNLKPPPNNGTLEVAQDLLRDDNELSMPVKVLLILAGAALIMCITIWAILFIRHKIRQRRPDIY